MSPVFGGGGAGFFPKIANSKRIYANQQTITQAKLTATATGSLAYFLSADDGTHYEEVNSGIMHTFTNAGQYLRWKILLNPGSVVTNIEVEYS